MSYSNFENPVRYYNFQASTSYKGSVGLIDGFPLGAPGTTALEILCTVNCSIPLTYTSCDSQKYQGIGAPTGTIDTSGAIPGAASFDGSVAEVYYKITNTSQLSTLDAAAGGSPDYNVNLKASGYLTTNGYTLLPGWNAGDVLQSGTTTVFLTAGQYLTLVMSGSGNQQDKAIVFNQLPGADGRCFSGDSKILMATGEYKCIKDIQRGDVVVEDIQTGKTNTVSRVASAINMCEAVVIPKGLMGNSEDIRCTRLHPIWINDQRVYAKDIEGVEFTHYIIDRYYNLQFDEEGTFIVDGIKVDSLSPYHKQDPLPKNEFIDESKFIEGRKVRDENDSFRNKPFLNTKRGKKVIVQNL